MRSFCLNLLVAFSLSFLASIAQSEGKEFYIKQNGQGARVNGAFNFKKRGQDIILLGEISLLQSYAMQETDLEELTALQIHSRPPTDFEKSITAGMMILSSLFLIAEYRVFDINSEFWMSKMEGVAMLFIPVETYSIYQDCGNKSYLIAQSEAPSKESLERMKSVDEIDVLCGQDFPS